MVCLNYLLEKKILFFVTIFFLINSCQTDVNKAKNNTSIENQSSVALELLSQDASFMQFKITDVLQFKPTIFSEEKGEEAFLIGKELESKGDMANAEKYLSFSFNLSHSFTVGMSLIKIKIALKKMEQAKQIANYLFLMYPEKSDLALILANIYQMEGSFDDAREVLRRAYKNQPNNEKVVVLYSAFSPNESKKILLKFVRRNLGSVNASVRLARVYLRENDYKNSLKYANLAYHNDSENIAVMTVLGEIYKAQNNFVKAEEYFYRAFDKSLNNTTAQNYLNVLLIQGKYLDTLNTLVQLESTGNKDRPFPPELTLQIAKLFIINKNCKEAEKRLISLKNINFNLFEVKYYLAVCTEKRKEFVTALNYLDSIPNESELAGAAERTRIVTLIDAGEIEKAKARIDSYVIPEKKNTIEVLFKSSVLFYFGKNEEAIELLDYYIKQNPDEKEFYLKKAELLAAKNDVYSLSKSLVLAEKIAAAWPSYGDALNYLGYSLLENRKDLGRAKSFLKKAVRLEPYNGFYLDSLGWYYYHKNDFKNAIKHLSAAKYYEPQQPLIIYHLAMAQFANQDVKSALKNLESARKILNDMLSFELNTDIELTKLLQNIGVQISKVKKMSSISNSFILPNLFETLVHEKGIDKVDWLVVTRHANKWKTSVADALLDLNYVDESTLARCLARAHHLPYVPHQELNFDFSEVSFENFDDLMNVGAAPLKEYQLAICNPYDDHRGYLDNKFCEREMIVTERTGIIDALRRYGLWEISQEG